VKTAFLPRDVLFLKVGALNFLGLCQCGVTLSAHVRQNGLLCLTWQALDNSYHEPHLSTNKHG
jgi:hypothetical protein